MCDVFREFPLMFGILFMMPQFLLNEIVRIEYAPLDPKAFQDALEDGTTEVFVCLKDGRRIEITKPVCVLDDDESFFLKVPNPCNHDSVIAYVESAVAELVRKLLLNDNVLVPRYQVRTLPVKSPLSEEVILSPCCLIEVLEGFVPFGTSGNDLNVNISKEQESRLSEAQLQARARQKAILFSEAFAAVLVVMYFISNNDLHQENFGTALYDGSECLAILDFDMSPMQFLVANNCFGPFHRGYFTHENQHHDDDGGRHTPDNLDLAKFPELLNPDVSAENWLTTWCYGFNQGLEASGNKIQFRAKVEKKFEELANLAPFFFKRTFETIFTKKVLANQQELANISNSLTAHFIHFSERFQKVLLAHHTQRRLLSPLTVLASTTQAELQSPSLTSNQSFYGGHSPFFPGVNTSIPDTTSASSEGNSPDMLEVPLPPPTTLKKPTA